MPRLNDLRGALVAAAMMCRVAYGLRRRAFPELLEHLRLRNTLPRASENQVKRAQTDVRRAHRLVPLRPNCLLDSLTAAVLVRRQGFSVPLAIGVKMEEGEILAHAWVGSGESAADGFRLLYRVPHED